jgi:hypothetical protein
MNKIRRKVKKSFLLLELMMALALISGCALPLIRGPLFFCKMHLSASQQLELFFLSEKALSEVKQSLYEHSISWKEIAAAQKEPLRLCKKSIYIKKIDSTFLEDREIHSCLIKTDREGNPWAKITVKISYYNPNKKKAIKTYTHILTTCEKEIPLKI